MEWNGRFATVKVNSNIHNSGKKSNSTYHKVVCVIFLTKNELVGTNKKTIICCFLLPVWPASVRARKLDFPLWLSGTRNGKKYIRDFTAMLCRVG